MNCTTVEDCGLAIIFLLLGYLFPEPPEPPLALSGIRAHNSFDADEYSGGAGRTYPMTVRIEDMAAPLARMPVGGELRWSLREVDAVRYDEDRYDDLEHHLRALLEGTAYGAYVFERRADTGEMIVRRQAPGARVYDRQGRRLPSRLNRLHPPQFGGAAFWRIP
jgi:hypothetical protein